MDLDKEIDDILQGELPIQEKEEGEEKQEEVKVEEKIEEKEEEKEEENSADKGEERKEEETGGQESESSGGEKEEGEKEVKEEVHREEDPRDIEIRELREQLKNLSEKMYPKEEEKKESKTPEQEAEEQKQRQAIVLPFIKNEEVFDEVFKSHQSFNALLTAVVNTAREQALRSLPQVAQQLVDNQLTLRLATKEFFDNNKDLVPYRKFLGVVASEIEAAHPDYTVDQVFEEVEKEGRKRLRLLKESQGAPEAMSKIMGKQKMENPGFVPGGGGGRRGSLQNPLSPQEKDIMDIIS